MEASKDVGRKEGLPLLFLFQGKVPKPFDCPYTTWGATFAVKIPAFKVPFGTIVVKSDLGALRQGLDGDQPNGPMGHRFSKVGVVEIKELDVGVWTAAVVHKVFDGSKVILPFVKNDVVLVLVGVVVVVVVLVGENSDFPFFEDALISDFMVLMLF